MSSGIFLFGKNENGKRIPMEVEKLTEEERTNALKDKDPIELVEWIHALCYQINQLDTFLEEEGYTKKDENDINKQDS